MNVLLITRSGDNPSTELVQAELQRRGHQGWRVDTDRYPHELALTSWTGGRRKLGEFDLEAVDAVYLRRFWPGHGLPAELGDTRGACLQEASLALAGALAGLDCFHLDRLSSIRKADSKELQYRVATACGLEVPRTLFSNDPAEVREFAAAVGGELVTKVQGKLAVRREGVDHAVFTSLVRPEDLEDLESLRYCPMMFQERVPKHRELRATVVGKRVLTAAIDSTGSECGQVDYRMDDALTYGWKEFDLPEEVAEGLRGVARGFGLNYAAADFLLTPDGRYLFLEINAAGEWHWLAREPGLPFPQAIADVLVDPEARLER